MDGTVTMAAAMAEGDASAGAEAVAMWFAGVTRPVVLRDAAEVVAGIGAAVKGWPVEMRPATESDHADAVASVWRDGSGFAVASVYLEAPLTGLPAASAVCAVMADLSEACFAPWPGALALHCGAVQIGRSVVAFGGPAHAGKSTLAARLTAEPDLQVFCDDVLPVLPGGVALGLGYAPRLRLPLPAGISARFAAHVAAHLGVADDLYGYLPGPAVAPYGTTARLGAFVILDRRARGRARFHAVDAAEAAAHLLARDMAEPGDRAAHLARVTALAEGVPCLRLVYADLEDAVTLLRAAFGGEVWPAPDVPVAPPLARGRMAQVGRGDPVDPVLRLERDPMVAPRRGESGLWLVHRGGAGAFHLNPVAGAVWELLDGPATAAGIAADLAVVFPEVGAARIAADVAALLGALRAAGLVRVVSP